MIWGRGNRIEIAPSRQQLRAFGMACLISDAAWQVYATVMTINDLPGDPGEIARILVDPPVILPWLIALTALVIIGASFWPEEESDDGIPPATP